MKDKEFDQPMLTLREMVSENYKKTNEMYSVIMGNIEAKQLGIVHKVHNLEKAERNRAKMYMIISSISAGVAIAITKGVELMADHFNR